MTTCMESYAYICENLEWNPSAKAKEALEVIREFRNIFESADAAIENPVLQEICRNISRIHFGSALPLETMPVDTIRREFKKRTGKDISSYFCTIAYHNTIKADKEKSRGADTDKAGRGQKSGILDADTDKAGRGQKSGILDADTDKAGRGRKSGILDADTEQQKSLIHRLIKMAEEKAERCAEEKEEENREDKTTSCCGKDCSEDSSDNCPNCTCSGGN